MEAAFDVKAISPAAGAKFSPNLHAWMRKNSRRWPAGRRPEAFRDSDGSLFIGHQDRGDLIGSRLQSILASGARAQVYCFLGGGRFKRSARFWSSYLKHGRCFLDPQHRIRFQDERWDEKVRRRTCLWCGHAQKKVVRKRVVVERVWIDA